MVCTSLLVRGLYWSIVRELHSLVGNYRFICIFHSCSKFLYTIATAIVALYITVSLDLELRLFPSTLIQLCLFMAEACAVQQQYLHCVRGETSYILQLLCYNVYMEHVMYKQLLTEIH